MEQIKLSKNVMIHFGFVYGCIKRSETEKNLNPFRPFCQPDNFSFAFMYFFTWNCNVLYEVYLEASPQFISKGMITLGLMIYRI